MLLAEDVYSSGDLGPRGSKLEVPVRNGKVPETGGDSG
jgi:hypothetical protein